jgi:hypothetical protein
MVFKAFIYHIVHNFSGSIEGAGLFSMGFFLILYSLPPPEREPFARINPATPLAESFETIFKIQALLAFPVGGTAYPSQGDHQLIHLQPARLSD